MIIARSDLSLAASSWRQVTESRQTTRSAQVDPPGSGRATPRTDRAATPGGRAADAALAAPPRVADPLDSTASEIDAAVQARFGIMIELIERLTGRKIQLIDPREVTGGSTAAQPAPSASSPAPGQPSASSQPRQGWGIDLTSSVVRTEREQSSFAATGRVTTADGREIAFSIDLQTSHESVEVAQFRLRAGDALVDPLVLNFGGSHVSFTPSTINFDLNADGKSDRIAFVTSASGFLTLDANGNGRVDDGTELFGPRTGDGFAELARYDEDGNGWIDQADAVFSSLRIWDDVAGALTTLSERGVGAIALDRVATPLTVDAGGRQAGEIRSTGVWLGQNGAVGTIQHVDLAM